MDTRPMECRPTQDEAERRIRGATRKAEPRKGTLESRVFVLEADERQLDPCEPKRARRLLRENRAVRVSYRPFTIRLKDRWTGDGRTVVHEKEVRVDPGITGSGLAVVMLLNGEDRVVYQEEVRHRRGITKRLHKRKCHRRFRRGKKWFRAPRFKNRRRKKGRLPPSLESICSNLEHRVLRLARSSGAKVVVIEVAKFDTHKMQRPGIAGIEYQQGTLHGTHIRAYVRARDGGQWRYCDAKSWTSSKSFTLDHVVARANRGSSRPENLVLACRPCNRKKGTARVEDFLRGDPVRLAKVLDQRQPPLSQAPQVAWLCQELVRRVERMGLVVRETTGAGTAWCRKKEDIQKTHANDAACTRARGSVTQLRRTTILKAQGHGRRQQAKALVSKTHQDWQELPAHVRRTTPCPGHARRGQTVHGIRTGDLVELTTRAGQRVAGRAQVSRRTGRINIRTPHGLRGASQREQVRRITPRGTYIEERG